MLTVFRVIGVIFVIAAIVMVLRAPDAKENLKEDRKSLRKAAIAMVAFFVLACVTLAQVGR